MDSQRRLRGVVFITGLTPGGGGMNRVLLQAQPALRECGVDLDFFLVQSPYRMARSLVRLVRGGTGRYDFILFNSLAALLRMAPWLGLLSRLPALRRRPVYLYWHETAWAFAQAERDTPGALARVDRFARQPWVRHLAVSRAAADFLQKRYPGARVDTVYNCARLPAPFDRLRPPASPPVIVNAASIQPRKGTDLFVETAFKVCHAHPSAEFVWLGGGTLCETMTGRIREAGLEGRIHFPGHLDGAFLAIREASLLFLSSRDDPFPLAVLEAMGLGRTVLCFDTGGAPEAVGDCGLIVPPFDTDAAAAAILQFLNQPPEAMTNAPAREAYLAHYTPRRFAERLRAVLERDCPPAKASGSPAGNGL